MVSKTTRTIIKDTIKEMKIAGLSNSFIRKEITEMFEGDITKEDINFLLENLESRYNKRGM